MTVYLLLQRDLLRCFLLWWNRVHLLLRSARRSLFWSLFWVFSLRLRVQPPRGRRLKVCSGDHVEGRLGGVGGRRDAEFR